MRLLVCLQKLKENNMRITRSIFLGILALLVLTVGAAAVEAHMGTDGIESDTTVTAEEFEAVEDVMLKMMSGEGLTNEEWDRMENFMDEHHESGFGSMMGGMMMGQGGFGPGMMQNTGGTMAYGWMYWLFILTTVVWLLVGILLSLFLLNKLKK